MLTVGIDPAYQAGGAVLMSGESTVVAAWSWQIRRRKSGVVWNLKGRHGSGVVIRSLGSVADCINIVAAGRPFLIVAEDLFGRGRTLQRLAESTGEILGGIRAETPMNIVRVGASTWRPFILGCSARTSSDVADELALSLVREEITGLGQLETNPHVAEAVCIALYGIRRTV